MQRLPFMVFHEWVSLERIPFIYIERYSLFLDYRVILPSSLTIVILFYALVFSTYEPVLDETVYNYMDFLSSIFEYYYKLVAFYVKRFDHRLDLKIVHLETATLLFPSFSARSVISFFVTHISILSLVIYQ